MMRDKTDGTTLLLAAFVAMGSLIVLLLAADERRMRRHRADATAFQQLVGGLGLGPDTNWERCAHHFDARISVECIYDSGPLPGGAGLCPYRTFSILTPAAGSRSLHTIGPHENADFP